MMLSEQDAKRFWSKVDIRGSDECWDWQAGGHAGYGTFMHDRKQEYVHRIAWMIVNDQRVPDGLVVRHKCDNRRCCNPTHLELGTQVDNMRDMVERGRSARGSKATSAVLDEDDVVEILRLLSGKRMQKEIAAMFGVSRETINAIATGRTWTWLTGKVNVR